MGQAALLDGGRKLDTAGENLATSKGTTITAGAVNVKGSYTELIASTPFAAGGILVQVGDESNLGFYLMDISVGTATEKILLPNLFMAFSSKEKMCRSFYFPVSIPESVRLTARIQCSVASTTVEVLVTIFSRGRFGPGFQRVTAYGANTGDSGGVQIDPGSVAHTKPSTFTEIDAAIAHAIKWLGIAVGEDDGLRSKQGYLMDLALGAVSSEKIVVPDLQFCWHNKVLNMHPCFQGFPVDLAQAIRLSGRAQSGFTVAGQREFDIVLYGAD